MNKLVKIYSGKDYDLYAIPEKICAIIKVNKVEIDLFSLEIYVEGAKEFTIYFENEEELEKTFSELQSTIKKSIESEVKEE